MSGILAWSATPVCDRPDYRVEVTRGRVAIRDIASLSANANRTRADRFRQLAQVWADETLNVSSVTEAERHPAYREIVRMGMPAVPLLLEELDREPNLWFGALQAITGENPIPAEDRGDILKMARAWVTWGAENGFF